MVKMNLDTGASVTTFPLGFGSDDAGDGRLNGTASGDCILDGGAWQFQGYDENGLRRSLNGRLTGVLKVLRSAGEIAYLRSDSGFMIPAHSNMNEEN